jgi:hypothetical protein
MEETMEVYEILAAGDAYQDHLGKKKRRYTNAGVAFEPKEGVEGMNCQVNKGVALTGDFIIRKRRERPARAEASGPEAYDDGADFLDR